MDMPQAAVHPEINTAVHSVLLASIHPAGLIPIHLFPLLLRDNVHMYQIPHQRTRCNSDSELEKIFFEGTFGNVWGYPQLSQLSVCVEGGDAATGIVGRGCRVCC